MSLIGLLLCLNACTSDGAPDCLQTSGKTIRETISLPQFTHITVFENIELILVPGNAQKVELETGENLKNEVSASVEGDRLVLRNDNGCNLFRSYGKTRFFVTAPGLQEIRSSTGLAIRSQGVVNFGTIKLISESFNSPETDTNDGSFELQINAEQIQIVSNGITYFQLEGLVNRLSVNVAAGDSRVDTRELQADEVVVNHRGTNDVLIRPINSLQGVIRGIGDVVSYNRPPQVDVTIQYKGELIFID